MPPEPVPTIADVILTIVLIYGAICLLAGVVILALALSFWAAERREQHGTRRDRKQDRYITEQLAVIDELEQVWKVS